MKITEKFAQDQINIKKEKGKILKTSILHARKRDIRCGAGAAMELWLFFTLHSCRSGSSLLLNSLTLIIF